MTPVGAPVSLERQSLEHHSRQEQIKMRKLSRYVPHFFYALLIIVIVASGHAYTQNNGIGSVTEYAIKYPDPPMIEKCGHHGSSLGSTHEITFDQKGGTELWITGQNEDAVVRVTLDGKMTFYKMPPNSGPHGIEFDADGRVWVTLEFAGKVVRLDKNGKIDKEYDVNLACPTCPKKIDSHPHGMGFEADGRTIWFTGKSTGTVGRIKDGRISTFGLPTVGSVPIYIKAGPDKNMWVTELVGNMIARVTPTGKVDEFCIPTHNSRPIAIVPSPDKKAMWFTEEAGNKVARIDLQGNFTEYQVPMKQANVILAGLSFDSQNNLWVEQYVDPNNPAPAGPDYIIKIDKAILTAADMSQVPVTFYEVPTRETIFHRIIQGPDGNMWFTEMKADKVGKLITGLAK
jgi:virginiamycin B lyase